MADMTVKERKKKERKFTVSRTGQVKNYLSTSVGPLPMDRYASDVVPERWGKGRSDPTPSAQWARNPIYHIHVSLVPGSQVPKYLWVAAQSWF